MTERTNVPVGESLDWLIIGGGIHGVHIAARFIGEAGVAPNRLRIVDPGDRLLERWLTLTTATGMTHLRSPSVHHLDSEPFSLRRFAGKRKKWKPGLFESPYDRPALSLFNDHCDQVIDKYGLSDLHIKEHAATCSLRNDEVDVHFKSGRGTNARNVVLALGASDSPVWPEWAPQDDHRVQHIFAPRGPNWPTREETIAVVGGGISAAQVALRLAREGHSVHLVSRHALRRHPFDSDPGWLGPKLMRSFDKEKNYDRRRMLIGAARNKGSVPPDVFLAIRAAVSEGLLGWVEHEVTGFEGSAQELTLTLSNQEKLSIERIMLATGFTPKRPGGELIDSLVDAASLPCASCGYPIVDSRLKWHPRVRVSGPLAELELGPSARNISGARKTAERLVIAAQSTSR